METSPSPCPRCKALWTYQVIKFITVVTMVLEALHHTQAH